MYEYLNLKAWPFQLVPDPQFATVWAGRRGTREQLARLLWKMQFAPRSSIHLLWANFGMGKTHALLHLQYLCKQTKGKLIPVYAVTPKRASGFLDVYRAIVSELPYDFLGEQLVKIGNSFSGSLTSHPIFRRSPGVVNAILAIRSGDAERGMAARQWLIAQPGLSSRELSSVGVTYRIRTPEDSVNALTALTSMARFGTNPPSKIVIMIDEFQRVGELRQRIVQEINSGLHTYFNENPNGLDMILSFSFGREDNVAFLLNDEIRSRAEPQNISLDVLSEAEAEEFMHDLLDQFRVTRDDRWAYPFTPEAIRTLIKHIARAKPLTPRRLMLYGNHVLLESQYSRGLSDMREIDSAEVTIHLSDGRLGAMDTDKPEE